MTDVIRCYKTGNPVGIDTWTSPFGGCFCPNCVAYRKSLDNTYQNYIDRLESIKLNYGKQNNFDGRD